MDQEDRAIRLLRLLLDRTCLPGSDGEDVWRDLHALAARNGLLLRFAAQLQRENALPAHALPTVHTEQRRAEATFRLVGRVAEACVKHGVDGVFISAVQHHPDVGLDIDLLILDRSPAAGAVIASSAGLQPVGRGVGARLAVTATYESPDDAVPLDIHHGRLGAAGEHSGFPVTLLARRQRAVVEGQALFVPSDDDQLVLQGMLRVYGRRSIRLADAFHTIAAVRRCQYDWSYVVEQARETGTLPGLDCYLDYLEQLHRKIYGVRLLDATTRAALGRGGWGRIELTGGVMRFPVGRVSAHLYLRQFGTQVRRGEWSAAGRSCLIPVVGATSSARRIARRLGTAAGRETWPGRAE
ncbi:MAG: nucleotidyltransferase family protein [Gemmatimonadetes bacterium]|nr:nucleotidyltransferase family protein [Gemmatimonadota bacterium]